MANETAQTAGAGGLGLAGVLGTAVPVIGAATALAGLGLAIGGAIGAKKRRKEQEAYESQQRALAEEQEKVAKRAAYDAEQQMARQQAQAQKASRRGKSLPFAPTDAALADAMYVGSGNAYDRWHQEMFGG